MPWEELTITRGGATDKRRWRIAVGSTGVKVSLPLNHDLLTAKYVRAFFGTGHDAGWVLLKQSNAGGRKVNKTKTSPPYLAFSTMPGLDKDYRLNATEVDAIDLAKGEGTKVRLPWFEVSTAHRPIDADENRLRPDPGAGPRYAAPALAPKPRPVDPATAAFVAGKSKPKPGKPERMSPADERAAIEEHLRTKGVTSGMSLEQAAEYLRLKGKDCVIRVGQPGKNTGNQTTWLEAPEVVLDGIVVTTERLFTVVNEYRSRADLPPVSTPVSPPANTEPLTPGPPPLKRGALPAVANSRAA